jgi:hypothetical protein
MYVEASVAGMLPYRIVHQKYKRISKTTHSVFTNIEESSEITTILPAVIVDTVALSTAPICPTTFHTSHHIYSSAIALHKQVSKCTFGTVEAFSKSSKVFAERKTC